jgi:Ca2+-transporting ATPase
MNYWSVPLKDIFEKLNSSAKGLSEHEAEKRLLQYGKNELVKKKRTEPLKILLRQFTNVLVIILMFATIIAYLLGDIIDSFLILIVLIVNAGFGFVQEYRAEQALEALKRMTSLKATAIRSGKHIEVDTANLVPGDVLDFIEGDKVPADCRVIEAVNLQADESALTGESTPVTKKDADVPDAARIADRINMLFSGTTVVRGHGKAIAVATGMQTEIGNIAKEIQAPNPMTPLQIYLDRFGKKLGLLILAICVLVFIIGSYTEKNLLVLFLTSVSLAVAAIPEGLPAIVTFSLAFGVKKMAGKKALVRRLSAVEALGSATVICTDKTGTLTENKMVVEKVYCDGKVMSVRDCKEDMLFRIGLICNNSVLEKMDPTEVALVESAKGKIDSQEFFEYKRMAEVPFSSESKHMTVICKKGEEEIVFMKGAPHIVLERCNRILKNGKPTRLTEKMKKEISEEIDLMAAHALRVIGLAYKTTGFKKIEDDLIFVGVQGMIDPPRKEVKGAIKACNDAGIKVKILTGDHAMTAKAIAEEIGLTAGNIMTGEELEKLTPDELCEKVKTTNIFARVDPSHKLKIVKALQKNGEVVAVTGDGVNDAPALKNADIGVSMGIRGTDVAREASDMVITDDNFATIVSAVSEGRRIFDNIKKSIIYLLSSNLGEVLVVFIASLMFLPLPLTAVQILWVNLLSDGFPALALSFDPPGSQIMRRKPSGSRSGILTTNVMLSIIRTGSFIGIGCLFLYMFFLNTDTLIKAQTVTFTALIINEFVRLQTVRQEYGQKFFSNKYLNISLGFVVLLQLLVLYSPLNTLFNIVPLGLTDWIAILVTVAAVFSFNHFISKFVKFE